MQSDIEKAFVEMIMKEQKRQLLLARREKRRL